MRTTWFAADSIISPLGFTTAENVDSIRKGMSGIALVDDPKLAKVATYLGKIQNVSAREASLPDSLTRFEKLAILSAQNAIAKTDLDTRSARVIFILSTTKGNISLLEEGRADSPQIHLAATASAISEFFKNPNKSLVVSSACISGVTAILLAKQIIEGGQYDHAVVIGADMLSGFIVSGFQCLSALSSEPCRPFDKARKGTTLGEAFATVILSAAPQDIGTNPKVSISGGAISNDANHISGPSRTGEELNAAIKAAVRKSAIRMEEIDFVSAHGTATLFNDEMEAKAFNLSGLQNTPLNSFKGYFGHTLGAAGVLEGILSVHSLINNEIYPTKGFADPGVSVPLNLSTKIESKSLRVCLKTASGFGGCNAAMILRKTI